MGATQASHFTGEQWRHIELKELRKDVEAELGLDANCVLTGVLDSVVTDQVVSLWQKGDPAAVCRGEGLGCLLEADAGRTTRLHTYPWIHVVLGP